MSTNRDDFTIAIRSALLQRGARQKFSLFVLILISVLIFVLDTSNIKPINILRSLLNDGIYRVSAISSSPIKLTSSTKNFFVNHLFVYEENQKLKSEIEELKKRKLETSFLETENKQLQELAALDKNQAFTTVGARIMLDKNSPYLNSVIINKGSNAGIKLGMPVLSKGHLVGRIVEVNYISSRILLLNDLNSRIPVVISPNGDQAILSGTGRKKPILEYLPENFVISENNSVYTSGKDGVLHAGISIGKAMSEEDLDDRIDVELYSDPNQIFYVNVVLQKATDLEAM